jgi:predicted dehydrogenase
MLWFFGLPTKLYARVEKISSLRIETDDNVDAVLIYPDGLRVKIHLDLFGRPHEKYIRVTGEKGSLHWSFDPNSLKYTNEMEHRWEEETFEYERNDMFMNAAKEFLEVLDGQEYMSCTAKDGADVQRVLHSIQRSTVEGCEIGLD